jgi:hypothetical protein
MLVADLRLQGLYLVPGVLNTTHVTQGTDQNYGIYKSSFPHNLRNLSQCWFDKKESLKVCDLALCVFGGRCPSTGVVLRDAFLDAFSIERNLSCWHKCRAVPLARAPLHSSAAGVRHEVPVGLAAAVALTTGEEEGDAIIKKLRALETSNRFFCDLLTVNGLAPIIDSCVKALPIHHFDNLPLHPYPVHQTQLEDCLRLAKPRQEHTMWVIRVWSTHYVCDGRCTSWLEITVCDCTHM